MRVERLTKRENLAGHSIAYVSDEDCFDVWSVPKKFMGTAVDRLAQIEDILGDTYDLDRLRELVAADKDERCVLLPVKPNLKPGVEESRCFILLDNGEFVDDNVYNVSIGPDNTCKMNTIYSTFDFGDFELSEVGHRIFWDENNVREAAEAALAKDAQNDE